MKKYRAGKIKREHTVIERVWPVLEQMAACELITSIIPGPISPHNAKAFEITFQRFTDTGLRLLAKNGSAVQEIWVVASDKEAALQWLGQQAVVDWKPEPASRAAPVIAASEPQQRVTLPSDMTCQHCGRPMLAGTRAIRLGRRNYDYVHVRCAK